MPPDREYFQRTARELFKRAEPERRFQDAMVTDMMSIILEKGLDGSKTVEVRRSLNTQLRGHLQRKFSEGVGRTQPNLEALKNVVLQMLEAFKGAHPEQVPPNLKRNLEKAFAFGARGPISPRETQSRSTRSAPGSLREQSNGVEDSAAEAAGTSAEDTAPFTAELAGLANAREAQVCSNNAGHADRLHTAVSRAMTASENGLSSRQKSGTPDANASTGKDGGSLASYDAPATSVNTSGPNSEQQLIPKLDDLVTMTKPTAAQQGKLQHEATISAGRSATNSTVGEPDGQKNDPNPIRTNGVTSAADPAGGVEQPIGSKLRVDNMLPPSAPAKVYKPRAASDTASVPPLRNDALESKSTIEIEPHR